MKKLILRALLSLCLLLCLWSATALGAEEADTPPEAPQTCTVTEGCSLPEGHEGECVLYAARYQKTEGGEWFYGTLKEAARKVYAGGRVEVLRDIELDEEPQDEEIYYYKIRFRDPEVFPYGPQIEVVSQKERPGIIVTKPMMITSAGDTRHTITYSPKGKYNNTAYINDKIPDCLIKAFPDNMSGGTNGIVTVFYRVAADEHVEIEGTGDPYVKDEGTEDEYVKIEGNKYVKVVKIEPYPDKCELCLENIILDGGWGEDRTGAASKEALVHIDSGKLILGSGAVLQNNNNASGSGGGLVVRDGAAVMLEGSEIRNCRADKGGGVYVRAFPDPSVLAPPFEHSSFTLQGGIIEDCEAGGDGGGLYVSAGGQGYVLGEGDDPEKLVPDISEVHLQSGCIRNNHAQSGGGIYTKEEKFGECHVYVDGAAIETNTAKFGGGIYIGNGNVHLQGGAVTQNHADLYGGGIYVAPESDDITKCDVILSGAAFVDGNTSTDSDTDKYFYDVYLEGSEDYNSAPPTHPMTVEGPLTEGASIGVSRWTRPNTAHKYRVVARPGDGYTITTSDLDHFYSDDPKYVTLLHQNAEDPDDPDNGTVVITHADVAFDNQGHGKRPPSQLIDADKLVTQPQDLTERGYTFESWYIEPECTTEWNFAENKVETDVKPQVLYAGWKLNHYLIEYDVGEGGVNSTENPGEYTVESPDITLKEPTREGYAFLGWKLTEVDEEDILSTSPLSATPAAEPAADIPAGSIGKRTFTAIWRKLPPYTVTYTDGVEDGEVFPDQVTGELEENDPTPAFVGTPKRSGYTFAGWLPEVAETVTDDAVYVAQWTKNPTPPPSHNDDDDDDPSPKPPVTPPALESEEHFAYVVGYPDGTVRPEGNITRSEVVSIFFRLMTDEFREEHWAESNPFPDVDGEDWYHNAASTAVKAGLIRGLPDGTFGGDRAITRAEFAAIAARFLSEETAPDSGFADLMGHWAKEEVDRAVDAGWIKGYPDGNFHPDEYITRAQVMTLVNRMLGRTPDTDGMREDMVRWPDCSQDAWYYADVQEATNSHTYERKAAAEPETWTAVTEVRDWTALEQ